MHVNTVKRLKHLKKILKNVKPEQFDMNCWSNLEKDYKKFGFYKPTEKQREKFIGCAIGWACIDKKFNQEGFFLDKLTFSPFYILDYKKGDYTGKNYFNDEKACIKFFGITKKEFSNIFTPEQCFKPNIYGKVSVDITPKDVIEVITKLIDKYVERESKK